MNDILIGRQQILDVDQNIHAYEILFRGGDFDLNQQEQASQATNQVISDTILEIGLNNLVGDAKAFINFTAANLLDKAALHLPKDRIVIEVLEDVRVDSQLIEALKEFSHQGYTIALDDFVLTPEWLPLLKFADIIKLDVMAMPLTETLAMIEQLKPYKLTLLAEKVETPAEFDALRNAGCSLFQGFFFSKPYTVTAKRLGINQSTALELLAQVNDPDISFTELSNIVSRDANLSYKLLRYINSAFFSLPNKIESIRHAITCLGLNEVKRWVHILTLSSISNKPACLFQQLLIRGKMCELLAPHFHQESDRLFLTGMLSSIDSVLDQPIEQALEQLPIANDIKQAILDKEGVLGEILSYTVCYERWELSCQNFSQIQPGTLGDIYLQSIAWANEVLHSINEQ